MGFSVAELLVSVSILAIMSGIMAANYHHYQTSSNLIIGAQSFANDMRVVQSYALSLHNFTGSTTPPAGGWGIHVDLAADNDRYTLFGDLNEDTYWTDAGEDAREVLLPDDVIINNITYDLAGVRTELSLLYVPPYPDIFIFDPPPGAPPNGEQGFVDIQLMDSRTSETMTIRVNDYGLVDINN